MLRRRFLCRVIRLYNTCTDVEVSRLPRHNDCLLMWNKVKNQQINLCMSPRVEKVTVSYDGILGKSTLEMTKGISTPLDCAKHLSEMLVKESAIAMVNNVPWDMNRPLICDCSLDFVHFKDSHIDPTAANNAFWQSCTLLLAAALETAFHHKHNVRVISLPVVSPQSGGFTCDISFDPTHKSFTNWIPSSQELYALSTHIQRMAINELNFEPLDVPVDNELFQKLFADNPLRSKQISQVFNRQSVGESQFNERNSLPVYRVGDFVECFTDGPLIQSTKLIGKIAISSFKHLGRLRGSSNSVYRVQGVAIPSAFLTHFTTFNRLIQWSQLPNAEIDAFPDYVEAYK